ncbi:MAG: DUF4215 domain-containing protein [Deltaproteobacteria bacterium]|nr:DUF4215 domain-containing protein [Deltaproteobacteria bacterium]
MKSNLARTRLLGTPSVLAALAVAGILCAAAPDAGAQCGNGRVDAGEQCDRSFEDFPAGTCAAWGIGPSCDGLYCDYSCRIHCDTICGDACWDPWTEECDDGSENSDLAPDACRSDCTNPSCGDGVADTGEQCDDGYARNSDTLPDACRTDCTDPVCGDGVIDVAHGEQCDLGAANSDAPGSACSTACRIPYCGNGTVETGEQCDDGNTVNTDECTTLCRYNVCGDGFVRSGGMLPTEVCDDGNNDDGDDCRYDCYQDLTRCGDGTTQLGEECDAAGANADTPDAACRTDCLLPRCGDGVVDTGEECDGADGCGGDCTWASGRT